MERVRGISGAGGLGGVRGKEKYFLESFVMYAQTTISRGPKSGKSGSGTAKQDGIGELEIIGDCGRNG